MNDEEAVAAIERRHELELLDRLLEERTRPVPPAPVDPEAHDLMIEAMRLIATTFTYTVVNQYMRRAVVVPIPTRKAG